MFKKSYLSIIFSAFLVGCGGSGSSDESVSAPLDSKYYGVWSIDTLAYVAISKDTITLFAFDEDGGCYESGLFTVDSSTATSLTATDVQTGEQSTSKFSLDGEQLIVKEDGEQLPFIKVDHFNPFPGCESFYGVTNVEVELDLSYLPPFVTVNRDAQSSGYVEYDYGINFDINKNGVIDAGDVSVKIKHFKSNSNYPDNHTISVAELGGKIWTYLPKHQSDTIINSTSDADNNIVQVAQINNRLTFNFNVDQNPLLAHINENTPVQIYTYLNYPEPEPEIIEGWQDGPWNWSSEAHIDQLPDEGFLQPNSFFELTADDATVDLSEGESMWGDIKSVQFKFSK